MNCTVACLMVWSTGIFMVVLSWSFIKSAVAQVGTLSVLLSVALDVSVVLSVPPRIPVNRVIRKWI